MAAMNTILKQKKLAFSRKSETEALSGFCEAMLVSRFLLTQRALSKKVITSVIGKMLLSLPALTPAIWLLSIFVRQTTLYLVPRILALTTTSAKNDVSAIKGAHIVDFILWFLLHKGIGVP